MFKQVIADNRDLLIKFVGIVSGSIISNLEVVEMGLRILSGAAAFVVGILTIIKLIRDLSKKNAKK